MGVGDLRRGVQGFRLWGWVLECMGPSDSYLSLGYLVEFMETPLATLSKVPRLGLDFEDRGTRSQKYTRSRVMTFRP